MSTHSLPPAGPRRDLGAFIAAVLIVLLFLLAGTLVWLAQAPAFLAPTPTPTPTTGAAAAATPDRRATHVVEDSLTAVAYAQQITSMPTPSLPPTMVTVTIVPTTTVSRADQPASPLGTPTRYIINIPDIKNGSGVTDTAATATAFAIYAPIIGAANSPLTSPTFIPPPPNIIVSPLETPTFTPMPAPTVLETATPLPTPTLPPTPLPTPTFTPAAFTVQSLQANVRPTLLELREGPSNLFGKSSSFVANTTITLSGRDSTGEWVSYCCVNNLVRWARQAYVPPANNQVPAGLPVGATPNDVRWLPVQAQPAGLPVRTPIPPEDAPLLHRDLGNSGRATALPQPVLNNAWPILAQAGPYTAPPLVLGTNVLIVSTDGHLYNWARGDGGQQWRYSFDQTSNFPLAVQDNIIYVAGNQNMGVALQIDNGGSELWRQLLPLPPESGFTVMGDKLFYVGTKEQIRHVVALNRSNGTLFNDNIFASAGPIQPLTIGSQLLFAGGSTLVAFDIYNYEKVWSADPGIVNIAAPPVYITDGRLALAELYVADGGGNLYLLDANTGVQLHNFGGDGRAVSNLVVGDALIYVAGNGYLKAFERVPGTQPVQPKWVSAFAGEVSNLFVDARQVLLVTKSGDILHIDPTTGAITRGPSVGHAVAGVAISGSYLFIARTDGNLSAFGGGQ